MSSNLKELIKLQWEDDEHLERMLDNYMKESSCRTSLSGLEKIKADVEVVWKGFLQRHRKIISIDESRGSDYLCLDYAANVMGVVQNLLSRVDNDLQMLQPNSDSSDAFSIQRMNSHRTRLTFVLPLHSQEAVESKSTKSLISTRSRLDHYYYQFQTTYLECAPYFPREEHDDRLLDY